MGIRLLILQLLIVFSIEESNKTPKSEDSTECSPPTHLVSLSEDGLLILHDEALDEIVKMDESGREMSVISIVGPWRSGKSYLLNEIINPGKGKIFPIGHTTNPHTKGIDFHMYRQADEERDLLFLDTAGLFCPYSTEQGDARLMALASLVSSIVIYNHHHVMNDQEVERFRFIVEFAQAVPSSTDRDKSYREFQPDLFWVMRDFYLKITDQNMKEINATQLLIKTLEKTRNEDIHNFFRTVRAMALPPPTADVYQATNLPSKPSLRSSIWKKELNLFRSRLFSSVRVKRFRADGPPMGGKELRDLLITFVRRLNSDKGIHSLNTMETLVSAINEQKISDTFKIFESLFQAQLPETPASLEALYQEAKERASNSLRESLESYNDTKLEENLAILEERMRTVYVHRHDRNRIEIQELISSVKASVSKNYKAQWDAVKLPLEMKKMSELDVKFVADELNTTKELLKTYISVDDDFLVVLETVSSGLAILFREQVSKNENLSERVCHTIHEAWTDRLREKIAQTYSVMSDLSDDFARMEADYQMKCRGPSRTSFSINRSELEDKLRKIIEERVEIYKLWCFSILAAVAILSSFWLCGLISHQLFTTVASTGIIVSAFFYLTNPLLKESLDWLFLLEATVDNLAILLEVVGERVIRITDRLLEWGSRLVTWVSDMTLG